MQGARFSGERVASQLNGASWFFQSRRHTRSLVSAVFSRLKSGTDYTRSPSEARENMKVGLPEIGGARPFRSCRPNRRRDADVTLEVAQRPAKLTHLL